MAEESNESREERAQRQFQTVSGMTLQGMKKFSLTR
jgi:hypothetical protein